MPKSSFVDFSEDVMHTPRVVRPSTSSSTSHQYAAAAGTRRPSTATSWASSDLSTTDPASSSSEEMILTFVDEARLYKAFVTMRDAFVAEAHAHRESCRALESSKTSLILENQVNVEMKKQLEEEEKHTKIIRDFLKVRTDEHATMIKDSEEEVENLYAEIRDLEVQVSVSQSDKMQHMFRTDRCAQELQHKKADHSRFTDLLAATRENSDSTQRQVDASASKLKTQDLLRKDSDKAHGEASWSLGRQQSTVDELIRRVERANAEKRTWMERYKSCERDLSSTQSLLLSMSSSKTEEQTAMYRDRALHYLKAVGAGHGIREARRPRGQNGATVSGDSKLLDALRAPELRNEHAVPTDGKSLAREGIGARGGGAGGAGAGAGAATRRIKRSQTPDVRESRKKLDKFIEGDAGIDSETTTSDYANSAANYAAAAATTALLRNSQDDEAADHDFDFAFRRRAAAKAAAAASRNSATYGGDDAVATGATARSGNATTAPTVSQGSALALKTGRLQARKAKAQEVREDWLAEVKIKTRPVNAVDYLPF